VCAHLDVLCFLSSNPKHTQVATFAMHRRIVATFCGALSSFNGLSGDTTELLRRGQASSACANLLVNLLTALSFFAILRYVQGW
jgi:fluoride ion exporter CrcB/FEX